MKHVFLVLWMFSCLFFSVLCVSGLFEENYPQAGFGVILVSYAYFRFFRTSRQPLSLHNARDNVLDGGLSVCVGVYGLFFTNLFPDLTPYLWLLFICFGVRIAFSNAPT